MLLELKNDGKIPDNSYFNLRSTDAVCPRIYGLPKLHKPGIPLRPIVSFINSTTYELSRFLCELLSPLLNKSNRCVNDSFEFVEFLRECHWRPGDVMISCDVKSLFTSVPVNLAVSVAENRLKEDNTLQLRTSLTVPDILVLLQFCLNASDFCFKGVFYNQCFGCPMGSPISVVIANLVMEDVEDRILSTSSCDVLYWRRYVDDTWVVLPETQINTFASHINSVEESIQFTIENEDSSNSLPFLDVRIKRLSSHEFQISHYSKPTCSQKYLSFSSHNPLSHKRALVKCLTKRAVVFSSCADDTCRQLTNVKCALEANGYPPAFIHHNTHDTRTSSNEVHIQDDFVGTAVIPYIANVAEAIGRVLRRHKVRVYYKPLLKQKHLFPLPKDPIERKQQRGLVYKIPCHDCDRSYIGQTGNSLSTRLNQHRAALRLLHAEKSAIAEHALVEGHRIRWEDTEVLERESTYHKRLFLEAWHTRRLSNPLNRCELDVPAVYDDL